MTRIFLFLVALILIGYGVACALDPTLPARLAGLSILNADGYAEMGAMYGGLQIGVGVFCLMASLDARWRHSALLLLVLAFGCLALMRGVSTLRASDAVSSYTLAALVFESVVTAMAAILVRRPMP